MLGSDVLFVFWGWIWGFGHQYHSAEVVAKTDSSLDSESMQTWVAEEGFGLSMLAKTRQLLLK